MANATVAPRYLLTLTLACYLLVAFHMHPLVAQKPKEKLNSKSSPSPALWVISDEDTTIYLFGFAPVLKSGTEWETDVVSEALNASNLMVVESDGTDPNAQAEVQALIPKIGLNVGGGKLSTLLTEDQQTELKSVVTAMKIPVAALDPLKPWLASVQLGALAVSRGGYDLENPPSVALVKQAKTKGITVSALEEPVALMKLMAGFSEEVQIGMLMHTVETLKNRPDQQVQLSKAWLVGDVDAIGELLHGDEGAWSSEKVYDAMLVQRNAAWSTEIKRLMAEHKGTVFFAVGLGHLAGKDSLIRMLQDDGLTVRRK